MWPHHTNDTWPLIDKLYYLVSQLLIFSKSPPTHTIGKKQEKARLGNIVYWRLLPISDYGRFCNYHWCDVLTDHRHFVAMIGDKSGEISTYKGISLGCLIVQRPHMSRQRLIKVQEKILWHQWDHSLTPLTAILQAILLRWFKAMNKF